MKKKMSYEVLKSSFNKYKMKIVCTKKVSYHGLTRSMAWLLGYAVEVIFNSKEYDSYCAYLLLCFLSSLTVMSVKTRLLDDLVHCCALSV